jgi:hypothetical protein
MRTCAPFLLLVCLPLAGCWQAEGSLVGGVPTVQPLAAGKVASRGSEPSKKPSHFLLTKEPGGGYRLTNTDKGTDFGDAVVLRFFAISGLPKDVYAFEAVSDDKCKPGNSCHPITEKSERDYGLVRLTKTGAQVTSPDCDKTTAKLPGVKAGAYGTCTFTSRASLETALRVLARQKWKGAVAYNYE